MSAPPPEGFEVVAVPMRTRFRGITVREAVLVAGPAGWGEFGPFADYSATESVPWWQAAREAAGDRWPDPVRDRVPVNATVPAVPADRVADLVARAGGCRTAKVKVAEPGHSPGEDVERVAATRDALGATGRIRVDANGAWPVADAVRRIRELDTAAGGLEYVEQPCATVAELAAVRRAVDVPIAADESVRRAADPLRVARAGAADIVVLKVAPLGGVRACLRLADQCGLPVVVSSALETSVGLAAGVALAAALPELPYACGLGTVALFTADVVARPLLPVDGFLPVVRPLPDPDRVAALRADPAVRRRWLDRLAAVRALA